MGITLRHAEKQDISAIKEIYEQAHAVEGTLQLPYPSVAMWETRQEKWGESLRSIVAEMNDMIVGHLGLHFFTGHRRKHVATIGMGVHSSVLGQGVGSALLQAAIDICDNWANISRIELQVFVDNEPAIALYKKYDFVIEGTHKKYGYKAGKYVDVYTMAKLKA